MNTIDISATQHVYSEEITSPVGEWPIAQKKKDGKQLENVVTYVHRELTAPAGLDDHAPNAQQYC